MGIERAARRENSEDGFTIVELVIALAILALVMAPMARVFWSSMRTAGAASHRTDGSSISSREIEAMHAIPYAQVGFYDDQPGVTSSYEGFTTVSLGDTSPSTGPLVPQIAPQSSPIVQGNVSYSLERHIVWVDAHDASSTYTQAYKRLTVIVSWSDQVGPHTVRQDSLLYPGGQGKFQGAMGGSAPTTSTTTSLNPGAPVLSPVTGLAAPAGETQVPLTWTQPGSGAPVTSFTIEYSTNSTFPVGNFSVVTGLAPSVASYTVPSLSAGATYYFAIIAYAGSNSAVSNVQSFATLASAAPTCTLGQLNVTGATTLSTTGTILENNGKVSENLALSWTTSGACTHSYTVKAVDPTGGTDPSSPYALFGSAGTYNQTVYSSGSKNWGIGLHTFTVWDQTTNSATAVVKTFKICAHGSASC